MHFKCKICGEVVIYQPDITKKDAVHPPEPKDRLCLKHFKELLADKKLEKDNE